MGWGFVTCSGPVLEAEFCVIECVIECVLASRGKGQARRKLWSFRPPATPQHAPAAVRARAQPDDSVGSYRYVRTLNVHTLNVWGQCHRLAGACRCRRPGAGRDGGAMAARQRGGRRRCGDEHARPVERPGGEHCYTGTGAARGHSFAPPSAAAAATATSIAGARTRRWPRTCPPPTPPICSPPHPHTPASVGDGPVRGGCLCQHVHARQGGRSGQGAGAGAAASALRRRPPGALGRWVARGTGGLPPPAIHG